MQSLAPSPSWPEQPREPRASAAVAAAALVCAAAVFGYLIRQFWPFTVDDAFIIARYAENLSRHHTLSWNPGRQPTEGFTGIVFVSLLALADGAGLDAVVTAKWLGVLGTLTTAGVIFLFARRAHGRADAGAVSAAMYLAWPMTALHAVGGLETSLYSLSLVLMAYAAWLACQEGNGRYIPAVALTALLSGLTRPEGALVGVVACAVAWACTARGARKAATKWVLLLLALPGLAYMLGRWYYFGYLLPNSVHYKFSPESFWSSVRYLKNWAASLGMAVWVLVLLSAERKGRTTIPLLLAAVAATPYLVADTEKMGYAYRFVAPAAALIFAAAGPAIRLLDSHRLPGRLVALIGLAGLTYATWANWVHSLSGYYPRRYAAGLERAHITIGKLLRQASPTGRVAVWEDAGAIPYYSGWEAMDIGGLLDAHIQHHGFSADYLFEFEPDVIVITEDSPFGPNPRGHRKHEQLRHHPDYQLYERAAAFVFLEKSIQAIYLRRSSPLYPRLRELFERSPQNIDFIAAGVRRKPDVRITAPGTVRVPELEVAFANRDSCGEEWVRLTRRYRTTPGQNYILSLEIFDGYEDPSYPGRAAQTVEIAGKEVFRHDISAPAFAGWQTVSVQFVAENDETEVAITLRTEERAELWSWGQAAQTRIRGMTLRDTASGTVP